MLGKLGKKSAAEVHFSTGVVAEVENGTTIMAASKTVDVEIDSYCDQSCSCSTCKVLILDGAKKLSKMNSDEREVLGAKLVKQGYRLSCQAQINGKVKVEVPEYF